MGTGDIALPSFRWLADGIHRPLALVTQPDRPAGRHRELRAPAIKDEAVSRGIPVMQPEKVRDAAFLEELAALEPDLIVVMAYGQILPKKLIRIPGVACVNLHASLLPKYRGAACIQAAIDAGDAETGITLMHVVRELDAGDVIAAMKLKIDAADTGGSLHDRLAGVAADLLKASFEDLMAGRAARVPQAGLGEASHVGKLDREDGRLDWKWTAARLSRRIRAYDPWPGTWCLDPGGEKRIKIFPAIGEGDCAGRPGELFEEGSALHVCCGGGSLILGDVQPDGGRRMAALDWWRGRKEREASCLG
ncbi:MAG: methionyl-tRNA formyltransferase [Akkermansiaceae bacterium]|nr:methionyl-tRNA formyltransferase [Akkermansiaceae bacterium]